MDEQDRTDLTDNTEQTPRSEQNPGQPESAAVNFVMQDIPAGQNHEEVRPASTLQGTYAQHRAQQTPPGSDGRQANYNNIGGYPPQSNTQWRQSTPPPFGGGGARFPPWDRDMAAAWGSLYIRQSRRNRKMRGRSGSRCSASCAYAHRSSAEFTSATACCRVIRRAGTAANFNSLQRPVVQMAERCDEVTEFQLRDDL